MTEKLRELYQFRPRLYKDIFLLILTSMRRKPCGIISISCKCGQNKISLKNPDCALWREMSILVFDFLQDNKLKYRSTWGFNDETERHYLWIFYGHRKNEVEKLYRYQLIYNHTGLGLTLGYPPTAVHAFNKNTFRWSSLPKGIGKILGEDKEFLYFAPSKKYWREEIQIVRENIEVVKEIAPWLFGNPQLFQ